MCACSARQHIFPFSLGEGWSEARHTLAVADSLRVNEGRLYNDSLALAEAYTLLGHWRLIYPDDYARACYYSNGKNAEHPVLSLQTEMRMIVSGG